METEEDRDFILEETGTDLNFPLYSIKGIPCFSLEIIQNTNGVYDIESQSFHFQIKQTDFIQNSIKKDEIFTISLENINYKFKILSFISSLSGWIKLRVNLEERSYV